jgi:lysophospholipase L1-like esterase
MTLRRRASILLAVGVLAGVAACSGSGSEPAEPASRPSSTPTTTPAPKLPSIGSYVALGDSFTAGPGLAKLRRGSGFCLRSTHNWPSLLARAAGSATFHDESCSGAVTQDVLQERTLPGMVVPAQLDAVHRDTDLVTLGIGGNDGGLFTSLISTCAQRSGACGSFAQETVPTILDSTVPRIVQVLRAIRDRAPDARILLVGYLRILPESGTCSLVPVPAAEAPKGAAAEQSLDSALAEAARRAGIDYVSMRAASRGHDACAGAAAWTNGSTVADDDGVAFHPRLAGMRAVARTVEARLAKD